MHERSVSESLAARLEPPILVSYTNANTSLSARHSKTPNERENGASALMDPMYSMMLSPHNH